MGKKVKEKAPRKLTKKWKKRLGGSSTAGSAKGDNCKKTTAEVEACSSRGYKNMHPDKLLEVYRKWGKMKGNTPSALY